MESERSGSDLEDGEIREDDYEDISDGSLPDIVKDDCSDDSNIDSLRQEALKSLPAENETNEEEKYRLEALKSLLENTDFLNENEESLHEVDDLTEEEKYRLEAIKSLLRNTDFLENLSQPPKTRPSNSSKRRKRRKKNKNGLAKRIKAEPLVETDEKSTHVYLKETTSLLSELSEDVRKINKSLENKKTDNVDLTNVNKENDTRAVELNEMKSPMRNSTSSNLRSWYPKTEFTLLDISSVQNIEIKSCSSGDSHEVLENKIKCAFSQKNGRKLTNLKTISKRQVSFKFLKSSADTKTLTKTQKLTEVNFIPQSVTDVEQITETKPTQTMLENIPAKTMLPNLMEIDMDITAKKPTQVSNGVINKKPKNSLLKTSTLVHKFSTRLPPINKPAKLTSPRAINPCNFRYRMVLPTPNSNLSFAPKKNRYKINNTPNTSKYVLKKPTFKINNTAMKLNKTQKSRYSINHGNNKYKKVNSVNPKEFIISLTEEDSSKEEEYEEQMVSKKIPEHQSEIPSSTIKNAPDDEIPPSTTKSTPNNEIPLSAVETAANDATQVSLIQHPSRNEIPLPLVKSTSNDETSISPIECHLNDVIPTKIKEEPMDVPEELNEDIVSLELPSTTTIELSNYIKEEPYVGVIDTEPSPMPEDDTMSLGAGSIQSEEVTSVKNETNEITPPPSLPEQPAEKDEAELLYEAEENLIEIRSKLLSSLDELDTTVKQNSEEKQKLINLLKQLNLLKAAVTKTEDRIKTQKMKLVMSNSFVRSLCEGVTLRSKTCSKLKDLCAVAGKKIIGPQYRPPNTFEAQIEEKQKTVDISKYVRKPKLTDEK